MGRVFSYQEIETGQVPNQETFKLAKSLFAGLVEVNIGSGYLDGSFIYGSVAIDTANIRSDFDSFIALRDGKYESYRAAKEIIQCLLSETGHTIPVLPIVQTKEALVTGRHEIDRFFGQHLRSNYRIIQGNDPATYITFREQSAGDILATYLFQKKRRLANAYTSADPLNVVEGGLQRMLELPSAIGRKALQALTEIGLMPKVVEKSADKVAVLGKSRQLMEDYGLLDGFDRLVRVNQSYDDLLADTLKGRVDQNSYEDGIKSLHAELPYAINWIEEVELALIPQDTQTH